MDFSFLENENLEEQKKEKLGKRIFAKFFGFEKNIDLTNPVAVLKRRNQVIKNIVFIFNIIIFFIMLFYSLMTQNIKTDNSAIQITSWVITGATFPITFLINFFLKKLIKKGSTSDDSFNLAKQNTAMYFISAYLLIIVVLFYIKINLSNQFLFIEDNQKYLAKSMETFSYLFFYIIFLIDAIFQNKKLLINSFLFYLATLTALHFFVTHNSISIFQSNDKILITTFLTDIIIRTVAFIIFSTCLYITTGIASHFQYERIKELNKRQDTEADFSTLSNTILELLKNSPKNYFLEKDYNNINKISQHLAVILGQDQYDKNLLNNYNLIHLRCESLINSNFENLSSKDRTNLAASVIKRIELIRNIENILKNFTLNNLSNENDFKPNLDDLIEQNLILSELYYRLRNFEEYKSALRHIESINAISEKLSFLFDKKVLDTFLTYEKDFEKIYLDLE